MAEALLREKPILMKKIEKAASVGADAVPLLLAESLKFLCLCVWSEQRLSPPFLVDQAWHELILCTRLYSRFCEQQFGRFVHHDPGGTAEENGLQLQKTLNLYALTFGDPPPAFWGCSAGKITAADCGACASR